MESGGDCQRSVKEGVDDALMERRIIDKCVTDSGRHL